MNTRKYLTTREMIQLVLDDPYLTTIILDNKELSIQDLIELEEDSLPVQLYHIDLIEYDEDYIYDEQHDVYPAHVELTTYHISTIN